MSTDPSKPLGPSDRPDRAAASWLDDLALDRADADLLTSVLMAELAPLTPSPTGRSVLLEAAAQPGRLKRFAQQLAALVDVSLAKADALLDRVAQAELWERTLIPGLDAIWVEGGPAVAQCIRGFVRLEAGASFPDHGHLGAETMLILEGTMLDSSGAVVRPGETHRMDVGSTHAYQAAPGGTDLLFFTVTHQGITVAGEDVLHRDPT